MSTIKSSTEHLTLNADGTGKDIKLQANGSEKVIIKSDGKVGIGTSSPSEKLHISGSNTSNVTLLKIENTNTTGDTGSARIEGWVGNGELGWLEWERTAAAYNHSAFKVSTRGGTGQITERMRIDSAGRVTMPYQPSFFATCTETSYAKPGTGIIAMGSVQYNRGNHYNASTSTFTAPVTGVYTIWLNVFPTTNSGTDERYAVWVNGSIISYPYILGGGTSHQPTSGGMDLLITAGDSVYIYVQSNLQEIFAGHTGWGMTLLS